MGIGDTGSGLNSIGILEFTKLRLLEVLYSM